MKLTKLFSLYYLKIYCWNHLLNYMYMYNMTYKESVLCYIFRSTGPRQYIMFYHNPTSFKLFKANMFYWERKYYIQINKHLWWDVDLCINTKKCHVCITVIDFILIIMTYLLMILMLPHTHGMFYFINFIFHFKV